MEPAKYLFFIADNYCFEILRPLQRLIASEGGEVLWFVFGVNVHCGTFSDDETYTKDPEAAIKINPIASFVPGNLIPSFIPGLKVQVFHGLEWKKKGHFDIRDCFDLYCTQGDATTTRFKQLAAKHGYFDVVETGWPKLDGLFSSPAYHWDEQTNDPIVLFAPTFSPALTSAPALFDEINRLAGIHPWQWLVKFHPKMDPDWIARYQGLSKKNIRVVTDSDVAPLLQAADIMVSDTSSIIGEFALLGKPAVTLNNSEPGDYLIDIAQAKDLEAAVVSALDPPDTLQQHIRRYALDLHPYNDGLSAKRVLAATQDRLAKGRQGLKQRPLNLFRNLKMRRQLGYWRW